MEKTAVFILLRQIPAFALRHTVGGVLRGRVFDEKLYGNIAE